MAAAPFVPPPDFVAEHGYLPDYEPRGVGNSEMADVGAEGSPKAHSDGVVLKISAVWAHRNAKSQI